MRIDPATAHDRPAFSNGTEGDAWMQNWCQVCAHDAEVDSDGGCPLVRIAMLGQTPAEWTEDQPDSLGQQYRCIHFRARGDDDPEPTPRPEPDQGGLFARPTRAARMLHQQPQHQEVMR